MALSNIWVVAEPSNGSFTDAPHSNSSPRRARFGATVSAITWGGDAALATVAGEYGATTLYDVGDLGGALPGVPVASAIAALVGAAGAPDAILIPTSYDGRDIAGRLSARLDRPVLTNVTGLVDDGAARDRAPDLRRLPDRRRPDSPATVRASSSSARSPSRPSRAAARPPRSSRRHRATSARPARRPSRPPTSKSASDRSSKRPRSSSRADAGSARPTKLRTDRRDRETAQRRRRRRRAPSSTPDGSPTRTRSARPARPSSPRSTSPAASRARPSTWSA